MKKRPKKILLVDDELMIRRVLIRFFDREEHAVFEADSGWSALETFRSHNPFDAVLCDIYLGRDDGWKVVDYIQRAQPATPIVIMSGSPVESARAKGNYIILYKPFSPAELKKVLRSCGGFALRLRNNHRRRNSMPNTKCTFIITGIERLGSGSALNPKYWNEYRVQMCGAEKVRVWDSFLIRTDNLGDEELPVGTKLTIEVLAPEDSSIATTSPEKLNELWSVCESFIEEMTITCAETIHQSDRVIEAAYGFIEDVCDVVGYSVEDDG